MIVAILALELAGLVLTVLVGRISACARMQTFRMLARADWSDTEIRAQRWRLLRQLASLTFDVLAFLWLCSQVFISLALTLLPYFNG